MEGERKYYENSRTTKWPSQRILENLELTTEDLEGKKILDIGSGGASLALDNLQSHVVSIDPKYGSDYDTDNYIINNAEKQLKKKKLPHLSGLSEELPFSNDTFDLILSHFGSPMYQTERNSLEIAEKLVKKAIKEMARVLKEGGQIRLRSVMDREYTPEKKWIEEALEDIPGQQFSTKYNNELMIIKKLENNLNAHHS